MFDEWGEELFEQYGGMRLVDDAEEIGEAILKKYGASINSWDEDGEIEIILLDRGYLTDDMLSELEQDYIAECEENDEEPEEFFCEEMNWTVTSSIILEVEDGVICDIHCEDRAWGDDNLGDFDPQEIYTEEELENINRAAHAFLDAVTEPNDE